MTTIATDGREIAADGMVTGDGLKHMLDCPKVHRLKNGSVAALAGVTFAINEALEFLNGERDCIDLGDEFEALILYADGRCECMDGKGRRYWQSVPCASGSGGGIALGAMAAGASPGEAVEIAARYDTSTGGRVVVLRPEPAVKAVA